MKDVLALLRGVWSTAEVPAWVGVQSVVNSDLSLLGLSAEVVVKRLQDDDVPTTDCGPVVLGKLFEIRSPELCQSDLSSSPANATCQRQDDLAESWQMPYKLSPQKQYLPLIFQLRPSLEFSSAIRSRMISVVTRTVRSLCPPPQCLMAPNLFALSVGHLVQIDLSCHLNSHHLSSLSKA